MLKLQALTFERLCTGQIRETVGPVDGEDAVSHHLRVLADKTGSLIAASARIGAINTITIAPDGSLRGDNTDYAAAIDAHVHDRLARRVADGLDLDEVVGPREQVLRALEQLAAEVGAQAVAQHRHAEGVHHLCQ